MYTYLWRISSAPLFLQASAVACIRTLIESGPSPPRLNSIHFHPIEFVGRYRLSKNLVIFLFLVGVAKLSPGLIFNFKAPLTLNPSTQMFVNNQVGKSRHLSHKSHLQSQPLLSMALGLPFPVSLQFNYINIAKFYSFRCFCMYVKQRKTTKWLTPQATEIIFWNK